MYVELHTSNVVNLCVITGSKLRRSVLNSGFADSAARAPALRAQEGLGCRAFWNLGV